MSNEGKKTQKAQKKKKKSTRNNLGGADMVGKQKKMQPSSLLGH